MSARVLRHELNGPVAHLLAHDDGLDGSEDLGNESDDADIGGNESLLDGFVSGDVETECFERLEDDDNDNDDNDDGDQSDSQHSLPTRNANEDDDIDPSLIPPGSTISNFRKDMKILQQVQRSMPKIDEATLMAPANKKRKRTEFYTMPVAIDHVRKTIYQPSDWIRIRAAAPLIYDENARAHQYMLRQVNVNGATVPPPRGEGRVVETPTSLSSIRFEPWMVGEVTPMLYTTNTVVTAHFGTSIDLRALCQRLGCVGYSPNSFSAARLRCSRACHMLFQSGRLVTAGASSRMAAFIACQSLVTLMKRIGMFVDCLKFSEQNNVSTATCGFEIDLDELMRSYPLNVDYEPLLFPGAMYRIPGTQIVIICFRTGKCILTGVVSRIDALLVWRWFHSNVLWQFELKTNVFFKNDADYRRRKRQEDNMADSACQTICDITDACIADIIREKICENNADESTGPVADDNGGIRTTHASTTNTSTVSTSSSTTTEREALIGVYGVRVTQQEEQFTNLLNDNDDETQSFSHRLIIALKSTNQRSNNTSTVFDIDDWFAKDTSIHPLGFTETK